MVKAGDGLSVKSSKLCMGSMRSNPGVVAARSIPLLRKVSSSTSTIVYCSPPLQQWVHCAELDKDVSVNPAM
jgi:hypothetical protein